MTVLMVSGPHLGDFGFSKQQTSDHSAQQNLLKLDRGEENPLDIWPLEVLCNAAVSEVWMPWVQPAEGCPF